MNNTHKHIKTFIILSMLSLGLFSCKKENYSPKDSLNNKDLRLPAFCITPNRSTVFVRFDSTSSPKQVIIGFTMTSRSLSDLRELIPDWESPYRFYATWREAKLTSRNMRTTFFKIHSTNGHSGPASLDLWYECSDSMYNAIKTEYLARGLKVSGMNASIYNVSDGTTFATDVPIGNLTVRP